MGRTESVQVQEDALFLLRKYIMLTYIQAGSMFVISLFVVVECFYLIHGNDAGMGVRKCISPQQCTLFGGVGQPYISSAVLYYLESWIELTWSQISLCCPPNTYSHWQDSTNRSEIRLVQSWLRKTQSGASLDCVSLTQLSSQKSHPVTRASLYTTEHTRSACVCVCVCAHKCVCETTFNPHHTPLIRWYPVRPTSTQAVLNEYKVHLE